jgi:hypothetical protein
VDGRNKSGQDEQPSFGADEASLEEISAIAPSHRAEYFAACQGRPNRPRNWFATDKKKRQRRSI